MSRVIATLSPALAQPFSKEKTYEKGEWVLYGNRYYTAKVVKPSGIDWIQSNWELHENALEEVVQMTDVERLGSRYTQKDLVSKINEIADILSGRTAIAVVACCLVLSGMADITVQRAKLEDLYNDDYVITNVTVDGVTGGITEEQAGKIATNTVNDKVASWAMKGQPQPPEDLTPAFAYTTAVSNKLENGKQDRLTAGENITIVDNVISSTDTNPEDYEIVSALAQNSVQKEEDSNKNLTAVTVGTRANDSPIDEWSQTKKYFMNDLVRHNGEIFICTVGPRDSVDPDSWMSQSAMGYWTSIGRGANSFTRGSLNVASGENGYAGGVNSYSGGGFAEGFKCRAMANGAHAEGSYSIAQYGHADGEGCSAEKNASHALGVSAYAKHNSSYVWQGGPADKTHYGVPPYESHADGTYNINPVGGIDGFWIGSKTIRTIIEEVSGGGGSVTRLYNETGDQFISGDGEVYVKQGSTGEFTKSDDLAKKSELRYGTATSSGVHDSLHVTHGNIYDVSATDRITIILNESTTPNKASDIVIRVQNSSSTTDLSVELSGFSPVDYVGDFSMGLNMNTAAYFTLTWTGAHWLLGRADITRTIQ